MCYIVCGVVLEAGRVLMVQEAKPSCRGKWYLPAGRMERNESVVVRRHGLVYTCILAGNARTHTHTHTRLLADSKNLELAS